jgi:phosphate uptake regulator
MEFRKLIRFGNSSFVVSIPKKWIKKNRLGKGDVMYIDENKDGNLLLAPKEPPEPEPRTFKLNITDLSLSRIKREISSAYINNYQYYELINKKTFEDPMEIKDILTYFIGIEIMEETNNRILVKDFVDVKMVSIEELMKKMHLLLQSMFEDLHVFELTNLRSREKEIDKLFFLIRKLVLYNLNNPNLMQLNKKTTADFLILREVTIAIEEMGDEIKHLAGILEKNFKKEDIAPDYFELIGEIKEYYQKAMKIFFENNYDEALELSSFKAELKIKIHKTFDVIKLPLKSEQQSFDAGLIACHFLRLIALIHHSLRMVYTYHKFEE